MNETVDALTRKRVLIDLACVGGILALAAGLGAHRWRRGFAPIWGKA